MVSKEEGYFGMGCVLGQWSLLSTSYPSNSILASVLFHLVVQNGPSQVVGLGRGFINLRHVCYVA